MKKGSKYGNKKITVDGVTYDSKLEYYRWAYLQDLERQGRISRLRRQVHFLLIPEQTVQVVKHLKTKDKVVERIVEHKTEYVADFVYEVDGREVVEDTKSEATRKKESYIIRRKLMRLQGHPVREVMTAGEKITPQ